MQCSFCYRQGNNALNMVMDCVNKAMDSIKMHITFLQTANNEKDDQLQMLQRRNKELMKSVELLMNQNVTTIERNLLAKRRRTNSIEINSSEVQDDLTATSPLELNMALNSAQLLGTLALSPLANETIEETENVKSPRVLRLPTVLGARRGLFKRTKEDPNSDENKKPLENVVDTNRKSSWMGKNMTEVGKLRFKEDQKTRLSLNKKGSNQFRQTRLQVDVLPKRCSTIIEGHSGVRNDAISICSVPLKQASFVFRTSNSHQTTSCKSKIDDIFDFSSTEFEDRKEKSNELNDTAIKREHESTSSGIFEKQVESSSVVALSPPTPDIIFVDDSGDETTYIETMLIRELIKAEDTAHLKRLEDESIKKMQKFAKTTTTTGTSNTEDDKIKTTYCNARVRIKTEDDTHSMPQPVVVKEELQNLSIHFNQRFKINCASCEEHIRFVGHCMTDDEIQEFLRKCSHKSKVDDVLNETPEDFWNPHLLSFAENDPRNEVLLDTRFVGKMRKQK